MNALTLRGIVAEELGSLRLHVMGKCGGLGELRKTCWTRELPGFGTRHYASGRKVYIVQARMEGRARTVTIGNAKVLSRVQAMDVARRVLLRAQTGDNPAEERMRRGFLYLVAIMDWASRKVLAWRLSNTMDAGFCVAALEEALARFGRPEIFNTDQGSMDGRGRWMDNVFIERLWRSLKYECVYLHAFETGSELRTGLGRWITYYNTQRPHSGLAGRTPVEAYRRIGRSDHGGHAPHDLMIKQAA